MPVCQSFGRESLKLSLLGPDLPASGVGPRAACRPGGRGAIVLKRAVESFVWCLQLMGTGQRRKGVALVVWVPTK